MTNLKEIAKAMAVEAERHTQEMDRLRSAFGRQMRLIRVSKGISLREFGRRLNLSAAFLSDVELGRRSLTVLRIKQVLEQL